MEKQVFLYHGEIKYLHRLMKKFMLIDITAESDVPLLNISRFLQTSSASKAALIFMSKAFEGKQKKIIASIRVQNEAGNIQRFNVRRTPMLSTNGPTKYKHYIV